ncbi:MAG: metal ABC transporter permease [Alphaproteobacteria bacterium]
MFDLLAHNYNFVLVLFSTMVLGMSAGLVGCFLVLRRQALISDAVTHATLPGIGVGFLISLYLGYNEGRYLPILLLCSGLSAYLGALSVQFLSNKTRLSPDTAIASVMSFFYGMGLLTLSIIQNLNQGNRAGLDSFLLGQVSGLSSSNALLLSVISVMVLLLVVMQFKNLRLLCFDKSYATLIGMNVKRQEALLLFLMILVVCAGLRTVGLIMIIALLIIPPITARLWSDRSIVMAVLSAFFGAFSCVVGTSVSKFIHNLPTGSTIIVVAFILFLFSLAINALIKGERKDVI